MTSTELNRLLFKSLPSLQAKYLEEVSWQEGDSTGSHTVFGDVLTPFLAECIQGAKHHEMKVIFEFIERVLELEDSYADEVIALSVFESIAQLFKDNPDITLLLGERSRQVLYDVL